MAMENGTQIIPKVNGDNKWEKSTEVCISLKLCNSDHTEYGDKGKERNRNLQHVVEKSADICRALCCSSIVVRNV